MATWFPTRDAGLDVTTASLALGALGVGSWVGRLGLAPLVDRLGRQRAYALSTAAIAAVLLAWLVLPVPPAGSLLAVGVLLGTAFGGFGALSPAVIADAYGLRSLSAIVGALYSGAGLGALAGPWLGGVVFDATGSYRLAIAGGAVLSLAAGLAVRCARRPGEVALSTDAQQRRDPLRR